MNPVLTGGSGVQGHPLLCSEFKVSLGYGRETLSKNCSSENNPSGKINMESKKSGHRVCSEAHTGRTESDLCKQASCATLVSCLWLWLLWLVSLWLPSGWGWGPLVPQSMQMWLPGRSQCPVVCWSCLFRLYSRWVAQHPSIPPSNAQFLCLCFLPCPLVGITSHTGHCSNMLLPSLLDWDYQMRPNCLCNLKIEWGKSPSYGYQRKEQVLCPVIDE